MGTVVANLEQVARGHGFLRARGHGDRQRAQGHVAMLS